MDMNLGKLQEMVRDRVASVLQYMGGKELDVIGRLNNNRNKITLHPKI